MHYAEPAFLVLTPVRFGASPQHTKAHAGGLCRLVTDVCRGNLARQFGMQTCDTLRLCFTRISVLMCLGAPVLLTCRYLHLLPTGWAVRGI